METEERTLLKKYYYYYRKQCEISQELKKLYKKGRNPNFPECISEFLAREICNATKPKIGDLEIKGLRIEVKCFASTGPLSFGPDENWDIIIFIDATDTEKISFIIYKISNTEKIWREIKVNKTETFSEQCQQKRRPRITFLQLYKQLPTPEYIVESNIDSIFQGSFPKLEIEI